MTNSTDKAHKTLVEKYGGEAELKKKRQEWQKKSRKNYSGNGGFRSLTPEQRKAVSKKALEARWGNGQDKA